MAKRKTISIPDAPQGWTKIAVIAGTIFLGNGGGHVLTANKMDTHWHEERVRKDSLVAITEAKDSADRQYMMRQNDTIIYLLKQIQN